MSERLSMEQAASDLDAARDRLQETYYEWAAQLAREAAWDALFLVERELGLRAEAPEEIGSFRDRLQVVLEAGALDGSLREAAVVLDEVLEGTLEPDHEPSEAWKEGGGLRFTTREDAAGAVGAAEAIVDACREALDEPASKPEQPDEDGEPDGSSEPNDGQEDEPEGWHEEEAEDGQDPQGHQASRQGSRSQTGSG